MMHNLVSFKPEDGREGLKEVKRSKNRTRKKERKDEKT